MLLVPSLKHCHLMGARKYAFPVADPALSNTLPSDVQQVSVLLAFPKALELFLLSKFAARITILRGQIIRLTVPTHPQTSVCNFVPCCLIWRIVFCIWLGRHYILVYQQKIPYDSPWAFQHSLKQESCTIMPGNSWTLCIECALHSILRYWACPYHILTCV